jgi:hypothetical protein
VANNSGCLSLEFHLFVGGEMWSDCAGEMVLSINPGNPRYRRGIYLLAFYSSSLILMVGVFLQDFGPHEHGFSEIRRYTYPKIDRFFNVKEKDIDNYRSQR